MNNEKRFITSDEAISLLNKGKNIHTFRNSAGMMLGCDWDKGEVIKLLKLHSGKIEIGGSTCRSMEHGIVVNDGSLLFIETNKDKLNIFDPIVSM